MHRASPCTHPIKSPKKIDITTTKLNQALVTSEILSEVRIKSYRFDTKGHEEHYFTIILENARVTSYLLDMVYEDVSFSYEKITWRFENPPSETTLTWDSDSSWKTPHSKPIEAPKKKAASSVASVSSTAPTPSPSPAVAAIIAKAATNSRSRSEALGKAGMGQAKNRMGHTTDPRYVDRYHGPDDIANDKEDRLAEWEAKGNNTDSSAVAVDSKGNRQGSGKKNNRRANVMTKNKSKKIDIPSNRQGGAYTQDEINLWEKIRERKGNKKHISSHTNTETGRVKVFERNSDGEIIKTLDDFKLENFKEIKNGLKEIL